MNNTIWLSGSRGFVGAYVKQSLISSGYHVKCVSNTFSKDSQGLIVFIDFSKKKSIKDAILEHGVPSTFIHLGWGDVYDPHHESHLNENLQNGINLIDQLYESGLQRFILIGSSSEYGNQEGELKESLLPVGVLNNYIRGKRALANYGLKASSEINRIFIHVRLFYAYGAGQTHNSLINQLFKNSLDGTQMNLSPCQHYRDYIHVSDVAEGLNRITKVKNSGVINLGSGSVIQLKEFVKLFWKECKADPALLNFGSHDVSVLEQSQPRSYASLSNLNSLTNWKPKTNVKDGIRKTIEQLYLNI